MALSAQSNDPLRNFVYIKKKVERGLPSGMFQILIAFHAYKCMETAVGERLHDRPNVSYKYRPL